MKFHIQGPTLINGVEMYGILQGNEGYAITNSKEKAQLILMALQDYYASNQYSEWDGNLNAVCSSCGKSLMFEPGRSCTLKYHHAWNI